MRAHRLMLVAALCAIGATACDSDKSKSAPDEKVAKADAKANAEAADAEPEAADAEPEADDGAAAKPAEPNAEANADDGAAQAPAEDDETAAAGSVTCADAAKNLLALMKPELEKQLAKMPEEQRAQAEKQMQTKLNADAIAAECEKQKPSQKELTCVVNAKTAQELAGCKGPPPPGGARPPGGAPPPTAPPPAKGE